MCVCVCVCVCVCARARARTNIVSDYGPVSDLLGVSSPLLLRASTGDELKAAVTAQGGNYTDNEDSNTASKPLMKH